MEAQENLDFHTHKLQWSLLRCEVQDKTKKYVTQYPIQQKTEHLIRTNTMTIRHFLG